MLGHSLGGGVAVRYAAERPGALRALALMAPAGLIATGAVRPSWRRPRLHAAGRVPCARALPLIASHRALRERAFARVVGDPSSLDAALARELLHGCGARALDAGRRASRSSTRACATASPRSRCRRS